MKTPAVAITGIGVVSPYGVGRERFWQHVRNGCSATRAITDFDASPFGCTVAAPVPHVSIDDAVAIDERAAGARAERSGRPDPRRYSRASLIGVIAATEAWADAGLRAGEPDAGVLVGSGAGGIDVAERQYYEFFTDGWKRVTPYAIPVSIVGMLSSEISIALELHGISHVVSTGCTSSTDAISYAAALIRSGEADVILSGGADACVTPGMIFGFAKMRAVLDPLQRHACRRVAAVRRRPRRLRPRRRRLDGGARARGTRAGARRAHLRDHRRSRVDVRRLSSRADGSGRHADRPRDAAGHRAIGPRARGDRLRELSRHVDRAQRCRRVALRAPAVRPAGRSRSWVVDQVDDRPSAGRERRGRHRHGGAGAAARLSAADDQPGRGRSRLRPRLHPERRPRGRGAAALCNCLGFGSKNSAIVLGRAGAWRKCCRERETDVVVVGAGPAGAIAALVLARAGVRVRVLDRARFPRYKLCGDTVNPGALAS